MSSGGLTDRPSFVPAGRNKLEIKQKKQACVNKTLPRILYLLVICVILLKHNSYTEPYWQILIDEWNDIGIITTDYTNLEQRRDFNPIGHLWRRTKIVAS